MADPKIKVEIGAETREFQVGIEKAEKELTGLGVIADIVSEKIEETGIEFSQAGGKLSDFGKVVDRVGDKLEHTGRTTELAENQIVDFGNKVQAVAPKIDKAANAQNNFNSVGIDFARIIQDAPFGIIGVSNNITQLASSFGNASAKGNSFTQILKGAFSGSNLLTIGISAITTALVLYEQGLFGAEKGVDDLDQAQKDFNDTLKETDKLVRAEFYTQILRDLGILEIQVTDTGKVIKDVFSDKTAEERLALLANRIKTATKPELEALATFLKENLQDSLRGSANATTELEKQIAFTNVNLYSEQLKLVDQQLAFYKDSTDKAKDSSKKLKVEIDDLKRSFEDLSNLPKIGIPGQNIEDLARRLRARREELQTGGLIDPNSLQNAIANAPGISTTLPITGIATQFQTEADKIKLTVEDLSEAFTGLGSLIGKAFKNPQLGTFLGQFATFAAKLIATNFKIAGSNAVAGATSAAVATGPAAPFTLAGFIAASLGLVASAFSAFGGGRGGSGSFSGASGMGTSFAGGGTGMQFDRSLNLVGEFRVKGQDLVYVFNEASSKNQRG
jgi:hypothetical protein